MNLLKTRVSHAKYGAGKITRLADGVVTIFFEQYGSHSFRYPDCFADEVKSEESEARRQIEADLAAKAE